MNKLNYVTKLDIFFFNEIECKKGRTTKMQPPWISKDPCITEEKGKRMEAQVFVHPRFEGLKIISAGKDGAWERVPVP